MTIARACSTGSCASRTATAKRHMVSAPEAAPAETPADAPVEAPIEVPVEAPAEEPAAEPDPPRHEPDRLLRAVAEQAPQHRVGHLIGWLRAGEV